LNHRGRELTEEVQGALSSEIVIPVVDLRTDGFASESKLPGETAGPDDNGDDGDEGEAQPSTGFSREPGCVEDEEADKKSTDDGPGALQSGDDGTGGSIEFTSVDSPLVGVEVV